MEVEIRKDFANVPVVWEPEESSGNKVRDFMKIIEKKYDVQINNYWDLHKWSIENLAEFWGEVWHYIGIVYSKPYNKVVDVSIPIGEPVEWFEGARMNYAENLLRYRDDYVALIVAGEDKVTERVTYAEMYEESKMYAAALKKSGIKKGDRVSCLMSNRKEALFAMLGTTSLGAIWIGALPLMGSQAVVNRFKQVQPKLLFTVDRFRYIFQEIEMLPKLKEIADALPSLEKVIIVTSKPESKLKDISGIRNSCFLDEFLAIGRNPDGSVPEMEFEQVSFSHPVFISYTSGTTGLPKALIHGFGVLLSISRDGCLHGNADRDQCWLSVSPAGWSSWNIFATMHIFGATIVVFEGVPFFLSPTFFWDMVDEFKITSLHMTPSVLDELEKRGLAPTERNHLSSLRVMLSGGSVVKLQNFDFVYKRVKKDLLFSSAYACTELMSFCMLPDQTLRMHRGEIPSPALAIDISVLDDEGKPILGEVGELVLNKLTPAFPLGHWDDPDRSKFKENYLNKFPGRFALGDIAMINPVTKGIIICGRSDETLKPGGCRFTCSEIYNIVDTFPEIRDSVCVSQYRSDGLERAVLFLKMKDGRPFDADLVRRLRAAIAGELSYRHVPEVILQTTDIPHNMNGKKLDIVVKKIINKMPYNPETVVNPQCLKNFVDVPELLGY